MARMTGCALQQPGRDRGALAGPLAGAAFVGGVAAGIALAGDPYPRPGADPTSIRRYFRGNAGAARTSIAGQLISAAALARFTASAAALARRSGATARLETSTVVAGGLAATSLAASALTSLRLTDRAERTDATTVALHRRVFVSGGPVHTAAFGGLVGCLSLSARRSGQLPDTLTTAGLASAITGVLAALSLVSKPAAWLIPAGRLSGLVVCGLAGARLSRTTDGREIEAAVAPRLAGRGEPAGSGRIRFRVERGRG